VLAVPKPFTLRRPNVLDELVAGALADALERRSNTPLDVVESAAHEAPTVIDAHTALAPGPIVKIIAEIKRASPSRGHLAELSDPTEIARSYERGGANAISVLTERRHFGGSLEDLQSVRGSVTVPLLRKDFLVTPYQIVEARAAGADLVLLIAAALDDKTLAELHALAGDLGMAVLVETHNSDEVARAVDAGATIIGVNARNLATFEIDRDLFGRLAETIPPGVTRVAESSVTSVADVAHYRQSGADVVLIGEALSTSKDPERTLAEFMAV